MRKLYLLLLGVVLFASNAFAQRTISGKVTDEKGNPVANASVIVKGTVSGTTTKPDGSFTLAVPATAKALLISSVDMATREIALGSESVFNVTLKAEDRTLQEVVVTGYGTIRKPDVTGSASTVKAPDIENKPFSSVDKALQGMVPGLQSVASSGQPGSNQAILIRGVSSISASSAPLWVIDGIPVNTGDASRLQTTANLLSTLNPNDIESITVLKDAASQSIYGSRAANGVIVVTTKKGKAGKTVVRFDTEVGMSSIAYHNDKFRPLNAQEYFDITREGLVNLGSSQATITSTLAGLGFGNGVDFNWYDAITRTATQQQYNLSMQGGTDKTTFYLSGGQFIQEGVTINSKLKRTNGNFRFTHKPVDRLTIGVNLNTGFVNQRAPLNGGAFGNPVLSSYFLLPSSSAYNADGSYNFNIPGGLHNTVALSDIDKRFLRETSLRGSANAEYRITDWLKFRTNYGIDYNVLEEDQYNNPNHGDGRASNGRAFAYYTRYFNWVWTNTLDLTHKLTKNGDLSTNAQFGYEVQKSNGYFSSVQSQDFPPNYDLNLPAAGSRPTTASATISQYSFISYFTSANLNWQNKYVVSGSFRRDGSSRFGVNNKYGNFWSLGASWNVDREAFMQNITWINQLKLRASFGQNGNANIGNYDWLTLYSYGANYNQLPGSAPSIVGDSSLTWELNKPFNFGIDIGIKKGRYSLSIDFYSRKSEDLLLAVPLSRTSGFTSRTRNLGALENKGVELALNLIPLQFKDFEWIVNFNYASNKNKVTYIPSDQVNGVLINRVGYPVNSFFLRVFAGVDPANGDPLWYTDSTHKNTTNVYPGAGAREILGNPLPKHFGSLTNTFNFKGFSVEAQFYYNFGNYVYDQWGAYYTAAGFGATFNKVARILDRWTTPGQVTDIPKYIYGGNKNFSSASTFYMTKGDFIRLRNIQLGYNFSKNLVSRLKMSNAFFYVRGTNLWTWVKDKNLAFDPEQGTTSTTNLNVFIPKSLTVGINLAF
jgi:TonB-dependent starch-binding outer membrane protein SusC